MSAMESIKETWRGQMDRLRANKPKPVPNQAMKDFRVTTWMREHSDELSESLTRSYGENHD
jgi:hypothetical protein